jgi:lipoprotein-releasing system permease protein
MNDSPRARPLPWEIAWRYLRGRGSQLLDGTARAAILATAIGVLAMTIAMALMTGYRHELQKKLIGANAAVVVYPILSEGAAPLGAEQLAGLRRLDGVERVDAVGFAQGVISSPAVPQGLDISLRGVEPGGEVLGGGTFEPPAEGTDGVAAALIGDELLGALAAHRGDVLRIVTFAVRDGAPHFEYRSVRVLGTFHSGFSEFDRRWGVVARSSLPGASVEAGRAAAAFYELRLRDPERAPEVAERAGALLGSSYLVTHWQEMNGELFTALRLQQLILFLVLGLIVVVSTFNVASTLVVLVRERMREVGVLSAVGLPPRQVRAVFLLYGAVLGAAGTLLGLGVGASAAYLLDRFHVIRFGADVAAIYFLGAVPFEVRALDLLAIAGFALGVNLLACLAPAWRAARVQPAIALRYE